MYNNKINNCAEVDKSFKEWMWKKIILIRYNCDNETSAKIMRSSFKNKLSTEIFILSKSAFFLSS